MSSWKLAKKIRAILLGAKCELCGEDIWIIGHHVLNRANGKHISRRLLRSLWNCQLRCLRCEINMHQEYKGGNNSSSKRIQEVNNFFIRFSVARLFIMIAAMSNRKQRRGLAA